MTKKIFFQKKMIILWEVKKLKSLQYFCLGKLELEEQKKQLERQAVDDKLMELNRAIKKEQDDLDKLSQATWRGRAI